MFLFRIFSLFFFVFVADSRFIGNANTSRERRDVEVNSRFGGNPFIGGLFSAGHSSGNANIASERGYLSSAGSNKYVDAADFSNVAASKTSSSSSSKSSKIKNSSSFGGGVSSVNFDQFGANQLGQFNYGANQGYYGNKGIYGGVGFEDKRRENLGIAEAGSLQGSRGTALTGNYGGSSNTEVEQSESNQNSESESFVANQGSLINAGSQYGSQDRGYGQDTQAVNYDQSFLVSE